ncbi:AraC family transcriptional regulator [Paenibacillus albidus]|uniref:AraC family transcriptional regulator n=1 Tax=Paenibacillus albidus TaxID=2041023 RepID=UPI001BEAE86C|nr:AraC family transcriptional regulator [Paenibacillus albidus]MBT2289578.1 AraC family transcriptional regulator [Paenibacillus albidus]
MKEGPGTGQREMIFYSLLDIEQVRQPSGIRNSKEVFREYTLIVITAGAGRIVLNGVHVPLTIGAGLMFEPGMFGGMESGEGGMSFYRLKIDLVGSSGERIPSLNLVPAGGLIRCGPVACQPFSQALLLLDALYQKRGSVEEIEKFASHTRFQELLLLIFRANPPSSQKEDPKHAVQLSIRNLQENYSTTLTVDQLAAMAGISRARYTGLFKEITGQLPLDYMNGIRIERAQQLLLLTKDRLNDIAQAVGYSNEYYFSRRFKGTLGVTPGQYRHSHQGTMRIFAPFLEDYLVALGIMPVLQYTHAQWGKQEYLGLDHIPEFDVSSGDLERLSEHKPELIMLNSGHERWNLEECGRIAPLFKLPFGCEDWRSTLHSIASVFGQTDRVEDILQDYKQQTEKAADLLRRSVRTQTVAVLRISARAVVLYGCGELGYIGNVLYRELGLLAHPLAAEWTRGERRVQLTQERLSHLHADHLFITFDKQEGEGRELLDSPLWRGLKAVRNGCVHEVDFMAWMNYGVLSHRRKIDDVLRVLA